MRERPNTCTEDTKERRASRASAWERRGRRRKVHSLIDKVYSRKNLELAWEKVKKNHGSGGIDEVTIEKFEEKKEYYLELLHQKLRDGAYQPKPVKRVEIPKNGGGVRKLGIPCVMDRVVQQALVQRMEAIFEARFVDCSYGYRKGRAPRDAMRKVWRELQAGYLWIVDADLRQFFDRVNHDVLMARVARRVKDKRVLRLIRGYLQVGVMEGGLVSPRAEGTPQGGPLSPLLSNILLDELDKELERRGHRFARYAGDVNVYVQSKRAGERVTASLERFLWKRLRLRINRDKSAVERPWDRSFLGYSVTMHLEPKLKVAPASVKRLKGKLRILFRRGRGRNLRKVCQELSIVLRGWISYYRMSDVKVSFDRLDEWIRRKLRAILWRQWKRPRTRRKELVKRGLDAARAAVSAYNGRGPWWNAGASHMHQAIPTSVLRHFGLLSLLAEHRRLSCSS